MKHVLYTKQGEAKTLQVGAKSCSPVIIIHAQPATENTEKIH